MKKFMKGVAKIRRGVGEFRKGGAKILWRGLLKGVADFCGGGCRILWREFQNSVEGVRQFSERGYVKRKAFFRSFFGLV